MRLSSWAPGVAALALAACSSTPPPNWVAGGTALSLSDAEWKSDGDPVELRSSGSVFEGGSLLFSLDRAGRVYDDDGDPAAILLPDGNLVGNDDVHLGRVGVTNA